jgi:hypothetical protein
MGSDPRARALFSARIDWFQVISDLGQRGFPSQLVADSIGVAKSTLLGWKQGAEPKHGDGERLAGFWCRVMDRPRGALPMVAGDSWWSCHSVRRSGNRPPIAPILPCACHQPINPETAMALPRKLDLKTPGEAEPSTPTEAGLLTTPEVAYVVDRSPGELPDASEIDARAITRPVLTAQGYVVPEAS